MQGITYWDGDQLTFGFNYDHNVRTDSRGRKAYGLTFTFWA